MPDIKTLQNLIDPHKEPDKQFYLDLLDADRQREYEDARISAVMSLLKVLYLSKLKAKSEAAKAEKASLEAAPDYNAEKYRRVLELNAVINSIRAKMQEYKPFFDEPYFARMDLVDGKEGYNSYYIGKRGDEGLEIVDWRAPLARKYYHKSRTSFSINEYDYKLILRRALRTKSGKVLDMKNEYLNLSDYLTKEEIGGRDEELIFDPFLREIIESRKEKQEITDIIETIQEKQYEIITLPEREQFVVQGVAGSGKTMILLHRLSYIMYNNERIKPADVLVITPSDSFNAFIDELAEVLELERVRTSTLDNYFLNILKSAGADITDKVDLTAHVPEEYAQYIYSDKFLSDVETRLAKIFDSVRGMFTSDDCCEAVDRLYAACGEQIELYEKIKNASLRVRRCVLGEIKEREGRLYYTKLFRNMFNCVLDVREFLGLVSTDERMRDYAYFYRQLLSFYKSLMYLRKGADRICAAAVNDLKTLHAAVEKEISDLRRYKVRTGNGEEFTYAIGIEKRENLLKEIDATLCRVERISDEFAALSDFSGVVRGESYITGIGKCEDNFDILRFFYRETFRKVKQKMGVPLKPLLRCDCFALCLIMTKLGFNLSPKYAFMFIDEGQDISPAEYYVLKTVNERAVFNIFGDLKQNVTPSRGIKDWAQLGFRTFELNLNYRNTNQIVGYVSEKLGIEMKPIGFDGVEVSRVDKRSVTGFLSGKKGLKAVICSESNLEKYSRKSYNSLRETGKISKSKINVMTVYESKGLEFTAVVVADGEMSDNEKYIAYTRALKELAIVN